MTPERQIELIDGCIAQLRELKAPDHALDARVCMAVMRYELHENADPTSGVISFWTGTPWDSVCHNSTSWPHLTSDLTEALGFVTTRCANDHGYVMGCAGGAALPWAAVRGTPAEGCFNLPTALLLAGLISLRDELAAKVNT